MQPRTTRCDQRPAERHGALVALALSCILAGLSCHGTRPAAGLNLAPEPTTAASTTEEPTQDGPAMNTDDAADEEKAPTSLTLTFLPGTTDALDATVISGTMADVVVDTSGTWHLPAVCFVADGLVPVGWQANTGAYLGDDAVTLPAATTVDGLTAKVFASDGAVFEFDLTPFVQDGTLTLTADWEEDNTKSARHANETKVVSDDDVHDIYVDDMGDADDLATPLVGANDTSTAREQPVPEETITEGLEDTDTFDEADDPHRHDELDGAGTTDESTQRADESGTAATKGDANKETLFDALALSPIVSTNDTGDDESNKYRGPALTAASEEPAESVAAGDAVAIVHGDTLTLTRVEGAPSYVWTGTVTDVVGNTYAGAFYPVSEDESTSAVWAGQLAGIARAEVAAGVRVAPRSCDGWFQGAAGLVEADLAGLDLSSCTDLSGMFEGCSSLAALDVSGWDVGHVTSLAGAFRDCSSLVGLDVSGWDVGRASDLTGLFDGCSSLTEVDVSSWDVGRVAEMGRMFAGCSSLASLDLSGWNVRRRLTSAPAMFSGCSSLVGLDLGGLNTSRCRDLSHFLAGCSSLESVDLSSISIAAATDLSHLLEGCASLTEVDLSPWDTSGVTDLSYLLWDCASLEEVDLTALDTSSATRLEHLLPEGGSLSRVTLGAPFSFSGANIQDPEHRASMPTTYEPPHTGRWTLVGTSTVLTAAEIEQGYDGTALAGTWVLEVGWAPLSLDLAGGSVPTGETYPAWYQLGEDTALPGTPNSDLAAPQRSGFSFSGWVDEANGPIEEIGADSTGTRTITATWEAAQVRVTVPVALTLVGTPDDDGTLSLAADTDAAVTNDGDDSILVSLALANAPASLGLSVPGDDETVELSSTSQGVRTLGAGDALALSGLTGSVDATDVSMGTPVATLAWTFAISDTPNND